MKSGIAYFRAAAAGLAGVALGVSVILAPPPLPIVDEILPSGPPPSAIVVSPPTPKPTPTTDPSASPRPSPTPLIERPTRIVIKAIGIDLPIITPDEDEKFPLCNVAEIETRYGLIGEGGITYLYGHARKGMFGPLLRESQTNGGRKLIGLEVLVYTDAKMLHRYEIIEVHPRQRTFKIPDAVTDVRLFLQTSETARASGTKLMVVAAPISSESASEKDALSKPRPVVCG